MITIGPIEQGIWLKNMGAQARLDKLLTTSGDEEKIILNSGFEMLVSPEKMGNRFKFLGVFPHVLIDHITKFPVSGF